MCAEFCRTRVILIIVLKLCIVVNPICGQYEQNECGKRQLIISTRILGGEEAKLDDWPWHAVILIKIEDTFRFACGGSIISRNAILTAAHCLYFQTRLLSVDEIAVHVGRETLSGSAIYVQKFNVSEVIVYPQFRANIMDHDIAILRLGSNITMTRFVQPVCIWDDDVNLSFDEKGTVVGFGLKDKHNVSEILQEVTLTMVDGLECLESDPASYGLVLTGNMFCAGGRQGVSACKGDSGGGMFFTKHHTWYVRGIVSFIPLRDDDTCDSSKSTVFTKVSKYHQWIRELIDNQRKSKDLEPCEDSFVASKTMCNVANRFNHSFLLVGHSRGIRRVPMNGGEPFNIISDRLIYSMHQDCSKGRVYWYSEAQKKVLSAKYDGTDQTLFTRGVLSFDVAVDWISRRLYWLDSVKGRIEVASLDNPNLRKVLFCGLNDPTRIVVDPYRGKLYWIDRDIFERNLIKWSNLDGTGLQVLVGRPQVEHPNSITISMTTGELCYTDLLTNKIECIEPNSKHIRTIATNLDQLYALAVTDDLIYWTSGFSSDKIERIDHKGVRRIPISIEKEDYLSIVAITSSCPVYSNACSTDNGGCPENTICLINPHIESGRNCTELKTHCIREPIKPPLEM